MRYLSILCAIIASVFVSGCIQTDTVIKVKPDGSGVIEETVKLSNELLETLRNFSNGMSEAGNDGQSKEQPQKPAEDPIQTMMKDAKKHETQYGPDVKFVSASPVKGKTMSGYKAIYAFKDINNLRINQNPENKAMKSGDDKDQPKKKEEIIRFNLVKGPTAALTITMPEAKPEQKPEPKPGDAEKPADQPKPENDPNAMEMMKAMFKDMSIRVAVEVVGNIVDTNATYREKSRITLLDMQFGKIFENAAIFEKVNAAQPKTVSEMKAFLKDIKGLKIEMNNPVVVQFK